jgi:hypothetical protein
MNKVFFSFLKEKTPPIAKVPFLDDGAYISHLLHFVRIFANNVF